MILKSQFKTSDLNYFKIADSVIYSGVQRSHTFARNYNVKKLLTIIILLVGFAVVAEAQSMNTKVNPRAKMKSLFIYKFAQSIEYPEAYKQGEFVIAVVNDDDLANSLRSAAQAKSINSQKVVIKTYTTVAEVERCHVIYIGGKTQAEVEPFSKKARNYNALIITEGVGMIGRLSAINFIISGNLIKFEMNLRIFREQDLTVSNTLEKLATNVVK